ncbi:MULTISPECIES: PEP-CTERM sorting domain-containing protein [unclassified Moorena]|uniref:PEP-CTERM sorting domain-containing protein n=1 Tax=unclassified Moorena TaxID=2683338 RepID=UPI0013FF260B|nr:MULTISPECIES: PEP-CTERM sorting domain-containing protein [unclassified Moorena]NEO11451.1 PEP-CTERM sorting domain-containing protein [Moorena sp. SIO3E8]NEP97911.1 PEP-CTERM sorting domain-containing protein [Moorena sp. SIO3F7]
MINFSKQLGVVTTAIALTSATVGVLPAAAFQIIKHEFSGTLELLSSPSFLSPEPPPPTRDYEGFVEYNTQGVLLSWFLDVEGLARQGFERRPFVLSCSTITSPSITSLTITFIRRNPPDRPPFCPYMFKATPDSWTIDRDFGRFMDLGGQTLTWNRESGIRFSRDFAFLGSTIYVDPNPNFKETITNDPSNWVNVDPNPNFRETITNLASKADATSVPEPASGLALLGLTALGAGSVLKRKDN